MRFFAALVDYNCYNFTSVRIYDYEGFLCSEKNRYFKKISSRKFLSSGLSKVTKQK